MTDQTRWDPPPRFRPPVDPVTRDDGARHFAGLSYALISGYRPLQLDLWVPPAAGQPALVVWIHGGAWVSGDRRYLPETLRPNQIFDALLDAGLAVASIDYRHAREAPFPAQLHDAKAALRYLRTHAADLGVDGSRVGVWGESAGGHLAALLALTADRADLEGDEGAPGRAGPVDAVVDWYGVADPDTLPRLPLPPSVFPHPPDLLLAGADPRTRRDAAPLHHVHPGAPPFLIVHGTADRVVPFHQSEQLRDALTRAEVATDLVPVDGADHIFAGSGDVDAVVDLSVSYIARALIAGPGVRSAARDRR